MNKQIIIANLRARPVRTGVSILAVALEVVLILVIIGLTTGVAEETGKRVEGVGADIVFQPPNASFLLALSSSPMPQALAQKISAVEGVRAVAPIFTMVNAQSSVVELVYGIDPVSFDSVSGGFTFVSGKLFSEPHDIVVDDIYAKSRKVKVGDQITLLNHTFKISGIVEAGKGARLFIALPEAQDMQGAVERASLFYVRVTDKNDVKAVIDRMRLALPNYQLTDAHEFASQMTSDHIPGMDAFFKVVVFVAVCVGVIVIFLSMYTTITERTREIGVLRSMGASKAFVVKLIIQESIFICLLGVAIGIGASYGLTAAIKAMIPTLSVKITGDWLVKAAVSAVLSGVLGSLYPSLKAATKDPVEALAYE